MNDTWYPIKKMAEYPESGKFTIDASLEANIFTKYQKLHKFTISFTHPSNDFTGDPRMTIRFRYGRVEVEHVSYNYQLAALQSRQPINQIPSFVFSYLKYTDNLSILFSCQINTVSSIIV